MSQTSALVERSNIAIHLSRMAMRQPHTMAVVVPDGRDRGGRVRYTHLTYRQLDRGQQSNRARAARSLGIGRGTRAVVMVPPGLDFFSLVFALFKAGVVPVLIDPGIGLRNLGQCCREAEPEVFIGIPKALLGAPRLRLGPRDRATDDPGRARRRPEASDRAARRSTTCGTPAANLRDQGLDSAPSIALLCPGRNRRRFSLPAAAPGPPKGAVYTHAIFQAQVESFRIALRDRAR